jgi:putative FmdB family regulatory protein
MQMGAYMGVEYMCQTCGEHFDVEVLAGELAAVPECPSCGSRDAEKDEQVGYAVKYTSPYDRGVCPCIILAQSGDPQGRK